MAELNLPGKQAFAGARFALYQSQPNAWAYLLQLFTNPAHGQRS
jgi:hypothetical protein